MLCEIFIYEMFQFHTSFMYEKHVKFPYMKFSYMKCYVKFSYMKCSNFTHHFIYEIFIYEMLSLSFASLLTSVSQRKKLCRLLTSWPSSMRGRFFGDLRFCGLRGKLRQERACNVYEFRRKRTCNAANSAVT